MISGKASRLALAVVLVCGLIGPAMAVGAASVLKSRMTGAQIANDDGGAPRGTGQAAISVNRDRGRLCFEIEYSGLGGKATGGFLRHGGPGELSRPAVVLFSTRAASPVSGCVSNVPAKTLSAIDERPSSHYVDVTTGEYPKGAIRGQLRGSSTTDQELEGPPSGGIG